MKLSKKEAFLLGYIFEHGVVCFEEENPVYPRDFSEEDFWDMINALRKKIREAK